MTSAKVYVPEGVDLEALKKERVPEQLRFAIAGGGMIASKFYGPIIEELKALYNITLVALVDPYIGQDFAQEHRCALYGDHEQMLDEMQPDATIISTPTALHGQMAASALKKGSAVLVEKPLGRHMADGDMIKDAQAESGRVVACVSQRRFLPHFVCLRDMISEGLLGDIVNIDVLGGWFRDMGYFMDKGVNLKWQGQIKHDWGVLGNQFVHDIDIIRVFMEADSERTGRFAGSLVESVSAWGGSSRPDQIKVPDTMHVDINYSGGRTAHMLVTTNARPGFVTQARVTGTEASAHIVGDMVISAARDDGTKVGRPWPDEIPVGLLTGQGAGAPDSISRTPHMMTVENFIKAIRHEEEPCVTLEDAYVNLQTLRAAEMSMERSMRSNTTVTVSLDQVED